MLENLRNISYQNSSIMSKIFSFEKHVKKNTAEEGEDENNKIK